MNKIIAYNQNLDSIIAYQANELILKQVKVEPSGNFASSSGSGKIDYYKVKSGDTLSSIAKSRHVTVEKLKQWNGLRKNTLYVGQRLKIYR
jgi:membrane-bound lytic murein transglycosylase D